MAFIRAPKSALGSIGVFTAKSTLDNPDTNPQMGDNIYIARSQEHGERGERQQWSFIPVEGLPGVYKIRNYLVPTLYITTPPSPVTNNLIYLDAELFDNHGKPSKTQLWSMRYISTPKLIAETDYPVLMILNYSSTGLRIDINAGDISKPLMLYPPRDNSNQSFYLDLSPLL